MNIPLDEWSGAGATKELHETIRQFVEESGKQARTMIRLTWWISFLTVAMFLAVGVQVYFAWQQATLP